MIRIIITTFDYKNQNNILAAKVLFKSWVILSASDTPAFMSPRQLMMTNDKKGAFQITVDLKSLQIKNQVVTKC